MDKAISDGVVQRRKRSSEGRGAAKEEEQRCGVIGGRQ